MQLTEVKLLCNLLFTLKIVCLQLLPSQITIREDDHGLL
ncbi:hypothetical protein swp_4705 [Shewanella piezotolerans WP3]|uniref:Uncharacterized protein n=1 Tax=Shewanella piezotolerans (strain WP3 / JCM 13877) TaxID=225849 RepID=B8CTU7_SHEPW|nr:hypothetical protein swp_4705 [Shewanella piezotolerans WP3]